MFMEEMVHKKREKNEIGIHAVRGGSIVGDHEVIFAGTGEVIELLIKQFQEKYLQLVH